MKLTLRILGAAALVLALVGPASATSITYTLVNNGGGSYTYVYTIADPVAGGDDFGIYFPDDTSSGLWGAYSNFDPSAPSGWTFNIYDPNANNTISPGVVEFIAGPSITYPAGWLMVTFDYSGSVPLGSQAFDVNNDVTGYIESGTTTAAVPEPASLLLMGSGLIGLGFVVRRRR